MEPSKRELADDSRARRAERRADADVALPIGGPRQQERSDVEACDEQHEEDDREPEPREWREVRTSGSPSLIGAKMSVRC